MWKIEYFGLKWGQDFGEPGGTPLPKIPRNLILKQKLQRPRLKSELMLLLNCKLPASNNCPAFLPKLPLLCGVNSHSHFTSHAYFHRHTSLSSHTLLNHLNYPRTPSILLILLQSRPLPLSRGYHLRILSVTDVSRRSCCQTQNDVIIELLRHLKGVITKFENVVKGSRQFENKSVQVGAGSPILSASSN